MKILNYFQYTLKRYVSKRALKYLFFGASAALVDFTLFNITLYLLQSNTVELSKTTVGFNNIFIANVFGLSAGFLWAFFSQRQWVFESKNHIASQFLGTLALLIFNMFASSYMIELCHSTIGTAPAKLLAQISVVIWNYWIYRFFIFK